MYYILLTVYLLLIGFSGRASAVFDEDCFSNSDCTAADFTTCHIPGGCTKGTCSTCMTDYVVSGSACKKDFGKSCLANTDCATGTCTDSLCACAGTHTWDSTYLACYTTNKGWGAACGTSDVDADCHVTDTGSLHGLCSGSGNGVCDCATGYQKGTGYVCRLPVLGEACDTPGCTARGISGTTGEVAPTCQSNKCACDTGNNHIQVSYEGEAYCTSIATPDTKIKTSLTCTGHNVCESGKCYQCNGTPGSVCIEESSESGAKTAKQTLMVFVFVIVAGLLHL